MQRWTAVVFVGLLAIAIAVVLTRTGQPSAAAVPPAPMTSGALSATATSPTQTAAGDAPADAPRGDRTGLALAPLQGPGVDSLPAPSEPARGDGAGQMLLNGQPAPQLAAGAPKGVTFGLVLVEYAGSEGVAPGTRSKEEALALAKKLAAQAQTDFKGAVAQGDKGSAEDFGAMPRGILEPAPEYVLFSLKPGEVSEPVDSPRGYYVFKRNE